MKVYLDYAATAPVKDEVIEATQPVLKDSFGNPSSIHSWGQSTRRLIDEARLKVANFLGADISEIIFTSGGSESDNLAIKGLIVQSTKYKVESVKPHIVTTLIEHHAILNTCKYLEKTGQAEVSYLKPNKEGIVEAEDVKKAIKENTVLVSIMYVNNEIGTVQPIREIGKMIKKVNGERLSANGQRIYFHTDAVQATEYQNMNIDYLHVDLLTLTGHKIGALKGTGVLYVRKGTPLIPMIHGGEQERGMRAGTENTLGIVALAKAIELILTDETLEIKKNRDYFIEKVLKEIPEVYLNGSLEFRSPNNANFYFKYIEGESILLNLDLVGIAASSGSACTSQSLQPSHVLMAVYDNAERAHGSIRFTLGGKTTKEEIDYVAEKLKEIIERLRRISPLTPEKYR